MTRKDPPLVLGLETSCDETSLALVDGAGRVVSSVVASQAEKHRAFGGVVPEIAARAHLTNIPPLLDAVLGEAKAPLREVGLVAATAGPGLVGALLVGLCEGKGLALGLDVPFVPVHHLLAHVLSPFLDAEGGPAREVPEDFAALVVSGGHTHLYRLRRGTIERLAKTRDDAAGEAYDKVAKMSGLGYPGGPVVDRLARSGRAGRPFPIPQFKDRSLDFSFSGLKTAVKERLEELGMRPLVGLPHAERTRSEADAPAPLRNAMADFQEAVVAQLEERLTRAQEKGSFPLLSVSGGVAANSLLRERLQKWGMKNGVAILLPTLGLTGDNAAMVGFAGLVQFRAGKVGEGFDAIARSRWPLEDVAPRAIP